MQIFRKPLVINQIIFFAPNMTEDLNLYIFPSMFVKTTIIMEKEFSTSLNKILKSNAFYHVKDSEFGKTFLHDKSNANIVYALFYYDKPVYVGRTKSIYQRIVQHKTTKDFTHFYLFKTDMRGFNFNNKFGFSAMEALLISYLKPSLNSMKPAYY